MPMPPMPTKWILVSCLRNMRSLPCPPGRASDVLADRTTAGASGSPLQAVSLDGAGRAGQACGDGGPLLVRGRRRRARRQRRHPEVPPCPRAPSIAPAVKANAYGHGLVLAARAFLEGGADWLCVNSTWEAAALREAGVEAPLYVMGFVPPEEVEDALAHGVPPGRLPRGRGRAGRSRSCARRGERPAAPQARDRQRAAGAARARGAGAGPPHPRLAAPGASRACPRTTPTSRTRPITASRAGSSSASAPSWRRSRAEGIEVPLPAPVQLGGGHPLVRRAPAARPRRHLRVRHVAVQRDARRRAARRSRRHDLQPALAWKTRLAQIREVPRGAFVGYGCTYQTTAPGAARRPARSATTTATIVDSPTRPTRSCAASARRSAAAWP